MLYALFYSMLYSTSIKQDSFQIQIQQINTATIQIERKQKSKNIFMSKEERFHQLYEIAKKKRLDQQYHEALKDYQNMLRSFDISQVDFTDYISVMAQLGDTERQLRMFLQSKKTYEKGLQMLKRANRLNKRVSQYQVQKQIFHLYSNLGLTECAEAESIQDKRIFYDTFKLNIQKGLSYFRVCEEIVVKMITEADDIQEKQEKPSWWKNQFIGLILNISNLIQIEAFEFKDKWLLNTMVDLINRAQKFYSLCKSKTKKRLQTYLSRCYYSKALCLKFLGKKNQCESYLKKDYHYCKQNDQKGDLEKTRIELIKFYFIDCFNFKEALKYTKKPSQIAEIKEHEISFNNLMRKALQIENKAKKGDYIAEDQIQELLFELYDKKCSQKALEINNLLRSTNQFKEKVKFRYWVQYYGAETLFQLEKYHQALNYLNKAKELDNDPDQLAWCALLNALIRDKIETNSSITEQAFRLCIQKSNLAGQQCKSKCREEYEDYKFKLKRQSNKYQFSNKSWNKLLSFMESSKIQKYPTTVFQVSDDVIYQMMPQSQCQDSCIENKKPLKKNNSYLNNCKHQEIQPLIKFQQLSERKEKINIQNLIYFPKQQILALSDLIRSCRNLDIRNISIDSGFLKKIRVLLNQHTDGSIKTIKINMIASISETEKKMYQELLELLKVCPVLEYLLISNAYEISKLTKVISSRDIISSHTITSLKLKQCNLTDNDLFTLNLKQNFPQLKKLSLAGNRLQGSTINLLSAITQLQVLSLSSNPLTNFTLAKEFQQLKKISLNDLSGKIEEQRTSNFVILFLKCSVIKMKNCTEVASLILMSLIECIIERNITLFQLKQLNFFGSIFSGMTFLEILKRFKRYSPNLSSIDIRNCLLNSAQNQSYLRKQLEQLQYAFSKKRNNILQDQFNPQNKNIIKQSNLKFISQNNRPLKLNKFSIY